jgi:methylmalonyl-CoA mutase cobalamin-binding domain/chain
MANPIRLLTAVPICDGHDSAINTINLEFIRHGIEVVYLGYHRTARDIVRAAIQEDVRAIGISSYNGGHVEFFTEVIALLKKHRVPHLGVFGGGGGTITKADAAILQRKGVDRIFFAGEPLAEIVAFVRKRYGGGKRPTSNVPRPTLNAGQLQPLNVGRWKLEVGRSPITIGITGPGGAGKTTLIDELVLRWLKAHPTARIAILSHDPSITGNGALLGDRATMIHSQDDRVFMRSLATRGRAGGLSPETARWLRAMKRGGFDAIFVETVGTGQEALPFRRGLVDKSIFVMGSDYGSRLQLQKIAMLDAADIVVVNKGDLAGAATAVAEIGQRLAANRRGQRVLATVAKRHRDAGVDRLFEEVSA